ncbi:hypothetical protein DSECCO2_627430 [anaerobic digester metagenome]
MIDISQEKMAVALTVAIQILAIAGFVACIVIGPQDRSSPIGVPDHHEIRYVEHRSEKTPSTASFISACSIEGGPPGAVVAHPGETLSLFHPMTICIAVGYLFMMA